MIECVQFHRQNVRLSTIGISVGYRVLDEEVVEWMRSRCRKYSIHYSIINQMFIASNLMPILWFLFLLFLQLDESRPPNASLNNDNNSQVPVTENVNGKSGKIEYQQTNIVWPRARALQQKREGRKIKTQNHYRKFTIPHNAVVNKPFIVSTLSRQSATRDVQSSGKSVHTWWLHIHHTTA